MRLTAMRTGLSDPEGLGYVPLPLRVHMLSGLPPPYGGVYIWTQRFVEAAPRYGIDVHVQRIGGVSTAEVLRWSGRLRRVNRGLIRPAWAITMGSARGANVLHICSSGGMGFWRSLVLVGTRLARQQACVLHLHSRAIKCSPEAMRLAGRLTNSRLFRVVTPSRQDRALWPFLTTVDHFVPASYGDGCQWKGPGEEGRLRLVFVGWMVREKGLFELLEAVAAVPGATLDAYGPDFRPSDLRAWLARINRLGLTGRVRHCGVVDHDALASVVAGYDALVLPSYDESFSFAAVDAMHLGVPVIATRVGFLWDAPASSFVPLAECAPETIATALRRHVDSKEALSAVARAGRDLVATRLTAARVMRQWRGIYTGIM